MNTSGHQVQVILICGGLRRNRLYIQLHADITGKEYERRLPCNNDVRVIILTQRLTVIVSIVSMECFEVGSVDTWPIMIE